MRIQNDSPHSKKVKNQWIAPHGIVDIEITKAEASAYDFIKILETKQATVKEEVSEKISYSKKKEKIESKEILNEVD